MIEIKDLLFKFGNLISSEKLKKESIQSAIFEVVGIQIKTEDIKIRNNTVYLNIKSIYKNEIFFKQEKIFYLLKKNLGKRSPKNIR
ncbi:hypothetical protein KKA39_02575 [Patescibacteria group bacterium]|nr:hypothetical protein [Patescibacteria group bacterium]MBU1728161.1 hypothetical protein [Patescibacteria group bacterium]